MSEAEESWGFDKWRQSGLPSERAYIEDMANVGEALMEVLPEGYCYCDCPSEIVTDLTNERDELKAALAAVKEELRRKTQWSTLDTIEAIHRLHPTQEQG